MVVNTDACQLSNSGVDFIFSCTLSTSSIVDSSGEAREEEKKFRGEPETRTASNIAKIL
jgi:hypothetical protein